MNKEEVIIQKLNIPLINQFLNPEEHKIFSKYTSEFNIKYAFEALDKLCINSSFSINRNSLFHKSISYLFKVLHFSNNINFFIDYDLLILSCFFLGIKTNENQRKIPKITELKNICEEKYKNLDTELIKETEVLCIKLLDYNINFLTSYDCLFYLLYNNKELMKKSLLELEIFMKRNINDFILKSPLEIAKLSIQKARDNSILCHQLNVNINKKNNIQYFISERGKKQNKNYSSTRNKNNDINKCQNYFTNDINTSRKIDYNKLDNLNKIAIINCPYNILKIFKNQEVLNNNKKIGEIEKGNNDCKKIILRNSFKGIKIEPQPETNQKEYCTNHIVKTQTRGCLTSDKKKNKEINCITRTKESSKEVGIELNLFMDIRKKICFENINPNFFKRTLNGPKI